MGKRNQQKSAKVIDDKSVEHKCLGVIRGNFVKKYPKGTLVKLSHFDYSKIFIFSK